MKDYYKILELEFGADITNIKKSYRRLALKYHPDKNKATDASKKFIEITEAYEVLGNKEKKLEYDNLYLKYFRSQNKNTRTNEKINSEKTQEWTTFGKKKAEEYASMKYDDFADRIIDELKLGISYIPNLIFILITGIGIVASLDIMVKVSGILGLVMLSIYSPTCYFLYKRARKDYIAERRHKILNKYK